MTQAFSAAPGPARPEPVARARDIADLIVLIPHLLGFHPAQSIVVLGLTGNRIGPTLRYDLPPPGAPMSPEDVDELERAMTALAQHCPAAMVFAFDEHGGHAAGVETQLHEVAEELDLEIVDTVLVCEGRWRRVVRGRVVESGRVPAEADVPGLAEFMIEGSAPLASRTDIPVMLRATCGDIAATDALLVQRWDDASLWRGLSFGPGGLMRLRDVDGAFAAWRRVLAPALVAPPPDGAGNPDGTADDGMGEGVLGELDPLTVAVAVYALADRTLRDEIFGWLNPVYRVPDKDMPAYVRGRALATFGPRDAVSAKHLEQRLLVLTQSTPHPDRAPVLTGLGTCAWLAGNTALAGEALQLALALQPEYALAHLLLTAVRAYLPPHQLRQTATTELAG